MADCGHSFLCFHGVGRPRAVAGYTGEERLQEIWGLFYISFPFFGHTSRLTGSQFLSCVPAQALQSCLTPCDPRDCGPPGSSVRGILQARALAWVTMLSPVETQGSSLRLLHVLHCRWTLYCGTSRGARTFLTRGQTWALAVTVQSPGPPGNSLFLK